MSESWYSTRVIHRHEKKVDVRALDQSTYEIAYVSFRALTKTRWTSVEASQFKKLRNISSCPARCDLPFNTARSGA